MTSRTITARLTVSTASLALAGSILVCVADADAQTATAPPSDGSVGLASGGPGTKEGVAARAGSAQLSSEAPTK